MKGKWLFSLLALLVLTGCVSNKAYKTVLDESVARQTELEKALQELSSMKQALDNAGQENEKLKKEIEGLAAAKDSEVSSLKAQIQELSSKGTMTSKEVDALRQEKERLSESSKAKDEEIGNLKTALDDKGKGRDEELAALKQQFDNQAKEREYLTREVERLKVKAGEISSEKEKELASLKNTYDTLVKEMKKEIEEGDIKITQAVDRLSVNLVEKILFDSGKAEVKPEGLKVLKRVGDILKGISDKQIRVEGHTDNKQIGARIKQKYPTNWELSTTRATNIVRYLQDNVGINPKMLSAAGFSEYKPVASNETPEGRTQNRRIEIVLLPLDVDRVLEELKK